MSNKLNIKKNKDRFRVPKSAQDIIPINRVWSNGTFEISKHEYSATFEFTDVNYASASMDDRKKMFLQYSDVLNCLEFGTRAKITIIQRKYLKQDFDAVYVALAGDDNDDLRKEYNEMILRDAQNANGVIRKLMLTTTVEKRSVEEANNYFNRFAGELRNRLDKLGSKCNRIDAVERLQTLYNFYRSGEEEYFNLNLNDMMKHGHSLKDYICPDVVENNKDHFKIGNKFGRTLFLKDYASFISDSMLVKLMGINQNTMLSIDVFPISTADAVKEAEKRLMAVESNIGAWQRRQNKNNNFSSVIPFDMSKQRQEATDYLKDLVSRDQRMMLGVITIAITADTLEQLDIDTDAIQTVARENMCQLSILKFQQLDGLNTVLPIGACNVHAKRTFTTESLSVFIPFRVQEIMDETGTYYGVNAISKNLLFCDKFLLQNQSAFVLGVPGSGKSMSIKEQIAFIALTTKDDIIICDPEGEFTALVNELKGQVINISATGNNHVNPLDMVDGYSLEKNPIPDKVEFVMSLFEQLDQNSDMGAHEKSIVDRAVIDIYEQAKLSGITPTLNTLYDYLSEQTEQISKNLALSLELFTKGSLNTFAHETNVDLKNRIVSYDIYDLGKQLKSLGLLVITDAILNRVTENHKEGKRTHIFIDEFHVFFQNEHSATFFNSAWRRFRKRGACPTAVTQNVDFLLDSVSARTMLSNSEFIAMFNQSPYDRLKLAELLNISEEQLSYITDAEVGCGLIKYGSATIPFENKVDKSTKLYKLMSTKMTERT